MASQRQIFEQLASRLEPNIRRRFLDAIAEIRNDVTLKLVAEQIQAGNIEGALNALNIDRSVFMRFEMALIAAYNEGGIVQAGLIRPLDVNGNKVIFRFGVRDLGAESWIARYAAQSVTRTVEEQRESIRQVLLEGLQRGDNPNKTALNIVGRVSRASNDRTGGLIGLTGPHIKTVEKARQALLSGDVEAMKAYLTLKRRDKRFDGAVRKAINAGKSLPQDVVSRITGRLSDRYLALRGETIGHTETLNALAVSRADAFSQAIDENKVDPDFVTKHWRRSPAEHPRVQHTQMSGTSVPYNEDFVMPDGTRMRYPHDENGPAKHTIGCRCIVEYRTDFIGQLIARQRAS